VPRLVDAYPLTPLQQGMLFHTLAEPDEAAYFDQMIFDLEGQIELATFEQAWRYLVQRHEVFRTAVVWEALPEPVQAIQAETPFGPRHLDWRTLEPDEQQRQF
jgi:hypothetical protein